MDDAAVVGGRQRLGQRHRDVEDPAQGEPSRGSDLVEGLALYHLHGQEAHPAIFLDRVQGDDVGMVEGGDGLGLALEALEPLGVGGQLGFEHLDRHDALEVRIPGPEHLADAAGAERAEDLVVAEPRARIEPRRSGHAGTGRSGAAGSGAGRRCGRRRGGSQSAALRHGLRQLAGELDQIGFDLGLASGRDRAPVLRAQVHLGEPVHVLPGTRPDQQRKDLEALLVPALEQKRDLVANDEIRRQKIGRDEEHRDGRPLRRFPDVPVPVGAGPDLTIVPDVQ